MWVIEVDLNVVSSQRPESCQVTSLRCQHWSDSCGAVVHGAGLGGGWRILTESPDPNCWERGPTGRGRETEVQSDGGQWAPQSSKAL